MTPALMVRGSKEENVREINAIVVHCADTPDDSTHTFTTAEIDQWHIERGFRRGDAARKRFNPTLRAIGYHYVIYRDGSVHTGRGEDEVGAHVQGANSNSLGVCLIGTRRFTPAQWEALKALLAKLLAAHPGASIKGHYQYATAVVQGKTCPNIDIPAYIGSAYHAPESGIYAA